METDNKAIESPTFGGETAAGSYRAVRIDDLADWRLIGCVSARGVGMWLRHTDPMQRLETLLDVSWQPDPDMLLRRIEDAVYSNPQVLDDFSADIAILAPNAIWVPTELVAEDEDEAYRLYNQVYPSDPADLMQETVDDATCLFSLAPGLQPFLQRTFPGARIHSHQGVMVRRFRDRNADMTRVYIDIREGEADFVAFDRKELIMAATHRWDYPDDIKYHLFNILSVFGLDPKEVQVSVSGLRDVKSSLVQDLRKQVAYVMMTMVPSVGTTLPLPLAPTLLLRR